MRLAPAMTPLEANKEGTAMQTVLDRRRFLTTLSGVGVAALWNAVPSHAAEGPLETARVRIQGASGAICVAPQYVAEELLRDEGFTDVNVNVANPYAGARFLRGDVDFAINFASSLIILDQAGARATILTGVHPACFALFGNDRVHKILDLKGKRVGVDHMGGAAHVFLSIMVAYVGLDPVHDIDWVASPKVAPMKLFAEGKVDAFLGLPPEPQELRARKIGHVVVDSTVDHPWSQYYCCMLAGDADYVKNYPNATKRVVRAILKATDLCASEPERVARLLVDRHYVDRYDYAIQTLSDLPYNVWREYDPEDTVRFYALRLRELGMIKSSPEKVIADNTNWHFLNELRRELKG
jgi:NitT/TauT family transport system substrate-binding protein